MVMMRVVMVAVYMTAKMEVMRKDVPASITYMGEEAIQIMQKKELMTEDIGIMMEKGIGYNHLIVRTKEIFPEEGNFIIIFFISLKVDGI